MKATGIVRRIDDLGRVVIPKEIRRTLRIREGDPLEIFVDREGEVILKKYSPIGELGDFAKEYADSLNEATGDLALITDRDVIIASSGPNHSAFMDKPITQVVEKVMEERKAMMFPKPDARGGDEVPEVVEGAGHFTSQVVAPIIAEGDPIGAVIIASVEGDKRLGDMEMKLAETAAGFLAKQMEQ